MLGKLIKYDFKAISKYMFPLYLTMLVLSAMCALMSRIRMDDGFIFSTTAMILGILLSCSFMITFICVVMRFNNALLKNEGYLSFALPVRTDTHILAKVISSIIWSFMEVVVFSLCLLIIGLVVGDIREIASFFQAIFQVRMNVWLAFLQILLLSALELVATICLFFAAISVSHLFEKYRRLITTIFIIVMVSFRFYFVPGNYNWEFYRDSLHIAPIWYIIPLLFAALYSFITWLILDKRLNLE